MGVTNDELFSDQKKRFEMKQQQWSRSLTRPLLYSLVCVRWAFSHTTSRDEKKGRYVVALRFEVPFSLLLWSAQKVRRVEITPLCSKWRVLFFHYFSSFSQAA